MGMSSPVSLACGTGEYTRRHRLPAGADGGDAGEVAGGVGRYIYKAGTTHVGFAVGGGWRCGLPWEEAG